MGADGAHFEIARECFADLIAPRDCLRLSLDCRCNRTGLDHLEQSGLDGVVDPQSAKGNAAWLSVVE
jgi:hypothetical protein